MTQKIHYHALDIMKIVSAFLVIINHTSPFLPFLPSINFFFIHVLSRIVVPFFFINAGYMLHQKVKTKGDAYFKPYMKKLFKIYLVWSILYIPIGFLALQDMMQVNWVVSIGALVMGFLNIGTYFHLWYLAALLFALYVVYKLNRKIHIKWILLISLTLFLFGLVETYYSFFQHAYFIQWIDLYFVIFFTTRNGIFFGLLFIALGFWMEEYDIPSRIKHPLRWSVFFFLLLWLESGLLRIYTTPINYNFLIMVVPFSIFWYSWLLRCRIQAPLNYAKMRDYSMLLYFSHAFYIELIPRLLSYCNLPPLFTYGWFRFLTVTAAAIVTSYVIRQLCEKKRIPAIFY